MTVKTFVAAAVALLVTTGAQASSTVFATLGNFKATTTAGSFAWDSGNTYQVLVDARDSATVTSGDYDSGNMFQDGFVSTFGTATTAMASASAKSLSVTLSSPSAGGFAYASATWEGHFNLGANSSVTFSWVELGSGTLIGAAGSYGYAKVSMGESQANAQSLTVGVTPGQSATYLQDGVGYNFWSAGGKQYASISTGSTGATLGFFARAEGATNDIAAVPEPEAMTLALSGLAIAGFLARRRRPA